MYFGFNRFVSFGRQVLMDIRGFNPPEAVPYSPVDTSEPVRDPVYPRMPGYKDMHEPSPYMQGVEADDFVENSSSVINSGFHVGSVVDGSDVVGDGDSFVSPSDEISAAVDEASNDLSSSLCDDEIFPFDMDDLVGDFFL